MTTSQSFPTTFWAREGSFHARRLQFHEKDGSDLWTDSGAISAAAMLATLPFADKIGWDKGEILGYTIIVLSALMVFFGIRSYRENGGGGRLTFGRGCAVGILITLISSGCYVGTWEFIYYKLTPDFTEKCRTHGGKREGLRSQPAKAG
jgi:hypothetical protein